MTQSELSFFYRGVLLLLFGGIAITLLSPIDQPWVQYVRTIGSAFLFVGGAAFTGYVALKQFRQFLNAPIPAEPLPRSLFLDRWYRVARLAVAASVLLALILVATLLFVEPPKQCPNWHLPGERSTSLWLAFYMLTAPVLIALVFMVVRWRWLVGKAIESVDYPTMTPVPYTLVMTVLVGCGMSQFPLAMLISKCWWAS